MPGIRLDGTKSTGHVFFIWFPIARYLVFNKLPDDFHVQQIDLGTTDGEGAHVAKSHPDGRCPGIICAWSSCDEKVH